MGMHAHVSISQVGQTRNQTKSSRVDWDDDDTWQSGRRRGVFPEKVGRSEGRRDMVSSRLASPNGECKKQSITRHAESGTLRTRCTAAKMQQ